MITLDRTVHTHPHTHTILSPNLESFIYLELGLLWFV